MKIEELSFNLTQATFDAARYFENITEGCYEVSDRVFEDIMQHPALRHAYRVRRALQLGDYSPDLRNANYTVFKSVSRYHLEFISGVVIVRNVENL